MKKKHQLTYFADFKAVYDKNEKQNDHFYTILGETGYANQVFSATDMLLLITELRNCDMPGRGKYEVALAFYLTHYANYWGMKTEGDRVEITHAIFFAIKCAYEMDQNPAEWPR